MTLALGTMGLFGSRGTVSMGEARCIVNEAMQSTRPVDKLEKADVTRYLNAFEVHSALFGLNPEEMDKYCSLLKCC